MPAGITGKSCQVNNRSQRAILPELTCARYNKTCYTITWSLYAFSFVVAMIYYRTDTYIDQVNLRHAADLFLYFFF